MFTQEGMQRMGSVQFLWLKFSEFRLLVPTPAFSSPPKKRNTVCRFAPCCLRNQPKRGRGFQQWKPPVN